MRDFAPEENLIITRALGRFLEDEQGRRWFDATSSLWVNVHGHNQPQLNAALRRQVGKLAHSTLLGIGNQPAALLAQRLASLTPAGLERVFYSDNGSTAVEVALKMAFQYHRHLGASGEQRSRYVALRDGYHGDTLGSVSVGGISLFHSIFSPLLFQCDFAPSPNCRRCPFQRQHPGCDLECVLAMDRLLAEKGEQVAAVVVEPLVQGAGGMVIYPPEVLRGYREVTRRHGVLLVADEVATGFGRTGTLFACQQAGVVPDLLALAKGLTGGYLPLAATLASEPVYQAFLDDYAAYKTFFHGHTYTGNPLGCAVALANLEQVAQPGFLDRVRRAGAYLRQGLQRLAEHPHVGDIRLLGLMGGVELVQDRGSGEPFPAAARTGHQICMAARQAGILARPLGDVVVLMPPLASSDDELDYLVDGLAYALDQHLGSGRLAPPRAPRAFQPRFSALQETAQLQRRGSARRLLVSGTDTGVGKTVLTACLAAALGAEGAELSCYKPVESGVEPGEPDSDNQRLAALRTVEDELPRLHLSAPLSPNIAARLEGASADPTAIAAGIASLPPERTLLVEGAGGLMVPITDDYCFADLAREAGLAVLVAVPDKLGCLNQALLTVRAAHDLGLDLAGVVLIQGLADAQDASPAHNERELRRLLGDLLLGCLPFLEDTHDPQQLAAAGRPLLAALRG